MTTIEDPSALSPVEARALFRAGTSTATSGWAAGHTQANLISVPADWAYDVLLFAQRNPQPCPVLDVTDRWRTDLVSFLIGCSFTFETALAQAGVPLRHIEQAHNVAMYVTNRECRAAGRLHGRLVVSMRPIPASQVATAIRVTGYMPAVHGAPVHTGAPAALGIADLDYPDFGDRIDSATGDVPVFWACGVTIQSALMASHPPFAITHAPGHMFITDAPDTDYLVRT